MNFLLNNKDEEKNLTRDQLETQLDHEPKSSDWVGFIPRNFGSGCGWLENQPKLTKA